MAKTKLELTWIGKDTRPKLEPRILLEDTSKSHHAAQRMTEHDIFDNRLIFGDNLLALKALAGLAYCLTRACTARLENGVGLNPSSPLPRAVRVPQNSGPFELASLEWKALPINPSHTTDF